MSYSAPQYLLLCEAKNSSVCGLEETGRWSFVLEQLGGSERVEVVEDEPGVIGERLQLLAVVRGLEALEQPSSVTLVTSSDYVGRGIRTHLLTWQENGFQWERYGIMVDIKNRDLWQRVSRALEFHQVECRVWNFQPHQVAEAKRLRFRPEPAVDRITTRWETVKPDQETINVMSNGSLSKVSASDSDNDNTVELARTIESVAS